MQALIIRVKRRMLTEHFEASVEAWKSWTRPQLDGCSGGSLKATQVRRRCGAASA